jgi:endo-1,4-beta-D-glucanase Y
VSLRSDWDECVGLRIKSVVEEHSKLVVRFDDGTAIMFSDNDNGGWSGYTNELNDLYSFDLVYFGFKSAEQYERENRESDARSAADRERRDRETYEALRRRFEPKYVPIKGKT